MPAELISETLRAAIAHTPPDPLPVIIEVALDRTSPKPYANLDARYQMLLERVTTMLAQDGAGTIVEPQSRAIAPYLFATLRAAGIRELAEAPADLIAHISLNTASRDAYPDFNVNLVGQVIAEPLGSRVRRNPSATEQVIIHLNVHLTSKAARANALKLLEEIRQRDPEQTSYQDSTDASHPYVFATMTGYAILALIDLDRTPTPPVRAIYRIWEDAKVSALITKSVATVKADAARIAFSADGKDITWAVLDTGIDKDHPHFSAFRNLDLETPLAHRDLRPKAAGDAGATVDPNGHGTHVAGIIAGSFSEPVVVRTTATQPGQAAVEKTYAEPVAILTQRNEAGAEEKRSMELGAIAGMAPRCKLVSLRVLEDDSTGVVSSLMSAIDQIQQWNDHGRNVVVHGANLSLGYPFDAEWFACGQSPLCIEVNLLVQSGVVVVVAAGNSGYGYIQTEYTAVSSQGIGMSINDPGNADLAITVGSTHRTSPHLYGVSYFSSKGPTGDGRLKPDLLAPGERIISCASGQTRTPQTCIQKDGAAPTTIAADAYTYKEDSGTSMAAPHVSGIIAGFLSIRREYIGRPADVKSILMRSATDLGRDRNFQGAGLVDLMRAIQSV